ncbi:MAG: hypothetical protein AAB347_08350 [Bacteroidota bacterium]
MNTVSIPPPFRFNPWKHHLHWVQEGLHRVLNNPGDLKLRDGIIESISSINSNYVDIYTGPLTADQLIKGIYDEFKKLEISDKSEFLSWMGEWGFKLVTLSDGSVWVLREGADDELYIHIHPARNSPNIIRIHGNSWKTAVVTKIFYPHQVDMDNVALNEVRVKHLNLSPIKNINDSQRLLKAMRLFRNS